MIQGSIDIVGAIRVVKFGLFWKPRKMYDGYITNKDEYGYEEFLKLWQSVDHDTSRAGNLVHNI